MTHFHDLYAKYAGDVYRFSLFLCGDPAQAEELTAETFACALTGSAPLAAATVKSYLLTIARNLYIESLRHRAKHAELSPMLPDTKPPLEDVISQRAELEAVQNYLQQFPELDRAALLLRADGVAYQEIAATLNISLAAAKVKVHRLRLKLAVWRSARDE